MSEPKASAPKTEEILPGVLHWSVHDDRTDHRGDAYAVTSPQGTILIDPLPLAEAALERLGRVTAICLTVQSHQRSSWRYRKKFKAPVQAPQGAEGLEDTPDGWYGDGDLLAGSIRAIHAPGPCQASYVFLWTPTKSKGDVLFLGDLLLRESKGNFRFIHSEYLDDPAQAYRLGQREPSRHPQHAQRRECA